MNETVTYEWSEELARSAMMAAHAAKQTRMWVMVAAGILFSVAGWWAYLSQQQAVGLLVGVVGIFWLYLPLRIHFLYRRLAKDAKRLVDDPKVVVRIDDDGLIISSGKSSRTIEWKRMSQAMDTHGFLIFYCGKIEVACLPRQFFSEPQIDFMKSQLRK